MLARRILGQPRRLTSCWRLVGTREGARVGDSTARWEWEDDKRPGQWAKRKLALSIGYLGTPYHGLQKTRTRPVTESVLDVPAAVAAALKAKDLPTVELALEKALHAAGCITTSNLGDLDRLGWSRMARTDKVNSAQQCPLSLMKLTGTSSHPFRPLILLLLITIVLTYSILVVSLRVCMRRGALLLQNCGCQWNQPQRLQPWPAATKATTTVRP